MCAPRMRFTGQSTNCGSKGASQRGPTCLLPPRTSIYLADDGRTGKTECFYVERQWGSLSVRCFEKGGRAGDYGADKDGWHAVGPVGGAPVALSFPTLVEHPGQRFRQASKGGVSISPALSDRLAVCLSRAPRTLVALTPPLASVYVLNLAAIPCNVASAGRDAAVRTVAETARLCSVNRDRRTSLPRPPPAGPGSPPLTKKKKNHYRRGTLMLLAVRAGRATADVDSGPGAPWAPFGYDISKSSFDPGYDCP